MTSIRRSCAAMGAIIGASMLWTTGAWGQDEAKKRQGGGETRALAAVSRWLERTPNLEGRFVQISPAGARSTGMFYVRRPGRARFEYDAPSQLLVVADGSWLVIRESEESQIHRLPLRATPLRYLLQGDSRLTQKEVRVLGARWGPGERLWVRLEKVGGERAGAIGLEFTGDPLELSGWRVWDAQNLETRVVVTDLKRNRAAHGSLFVLREPTQDQQGR